VSKIFVSIASYRDPELLPTLRDMLNNCKNPESLRVVIAWQHSEEDSWDTLKDFEKDDRFVVLDINHRDSLGVCWARHKIQEKYEGEEYYLQLDSHHRFAKDWDVTLKDNLNYLRCTGTKKPVLSSYLPSYFPEKSENDRLHEVWGLNIDRFLPEGAVFLRPYHVDGWQNFNQPFPTRFVSAHFIFTLGTFVTEVPYDPNLYFHGEETSLAARAFTHGYDLFAPHLPVVWHEYTREGKKKHWDDNSTWSERDRESYARFRKLFGMEEGCTPCERNRMKPYVFGNERTLQDYESYAGLKFSTRQIHQETRKNELPPIKGDYESGLQNTYKYCIDVYKGSFKEKDYDSIVVAFLDENGNDLYRKDCEPHEIDAIVRSNESDEDKFVHIWREYETVKLPHSWRVWPHSKSKGWQERIESIIRYE
jgi:hypothetical protein